MASRAGLPPTPVVRRSELTCPAHSASMMAKAAASAADEVIFDLEDACAVSQKVGARTTLIAALNGLDFGGKVRAFRPNGPRTPYFYRDLIEVVEGAGRNLDAVVLPKVQTEDDVLFADRLLSQVEESSGLPVGRLRLEVLIEGAQAMLRAERIAACSPRVASLIFGVADYAGDLGARSIDPASAAMTAARHHLLLAARAAGVDAIDHVTLQFRDLAQVQREAESAAAMGYDGKWAIHPSHLAPIHAAFTPSAAELERAQRLVEAYQRADLEAGVGAFAFGDEMIDAASLRVEQKKLAVARRAGLLPSEPPRGGAP